MLAETTLQSFAERIADDLPDDLAVLNEVQMPGLTPGSKPGLIGVVGSVEGLDDGIGGGFELADGAEATNNISLGGFAAEPSYQVNFSQHYRQQLLACF